MNDLPESTRLLYAQLLTQCLHGAVPTGRGFSFVPKRIKSGTHWYLQLTVGSRKTQHYLGSDSEKLHALIEQEKSTSPRPLVTHCTSGLPRNDALPLCRPRREKTSIKLGN